MYIPSCGWRVYRTEIWECEKILVRRGHTSILSQDRTHLDPGQERTYLNPGQEKTDLDPGQERTHLDPGQERDTSQSWPGEDTSRSEREYLNG